MTNREIAFPISTDELEPFMAHRKPMRWIDQIVRLESDEVGWAKATISPESLMFNEQFMISSLIELMGQAYGYMKAVHGLRENKILTKAYLAAIDQFEVNDLEFLKGADSEVFIRVETLKDFHPLYLIRGDVFTLQDELISTAKLKCFAEFHYGVEKV